MDPSPSSDRAG